MKVLDPRAEFRRILVICTRQIGDVLLTTPLIRAAKRRWPAAQIDVLGFAGTLGMLKGNPDVHELIEVPGGSGWMQSKALIQRLWRRYDLSLVAQHSDRAHLYGWIAARVRSGQVPDEGRAWWKRALLDHAVVLRGNQTHVVIDKLKLLSPWTHPAEAEVVAPAGAEVPPGVAEQLRAPYVVLQVPSLVRYKQWPLPHYAELARGLAGDGFQVLLTGGPSEADRKAVAEVARLAAQAQILPLAGLLDFAQLTTLLRGASLYVGPDTSVTHLAAACDVPVVALYGPIDPRVWGPWPGRGPLELPYRQRALSQRSGKVILLQGTPSCVPCNGAGCDRHNDSRSECLETMDPQRVLAEARAALGQGAHPPAR
ncbi:glycosyltransferase family 9 protein [Piscinibacter sp. XHJ-5]|uniref:glycosyltransferase family 9 protein n=1 Tax=Piscinibacter sp. XHJ-5 TaxID=3037797 RepID=UPI0024536748|nr:glycosyltransferase family 9 protein [Piscinibacter sp. XHJ-5]